MLAPLLRVPRVPSVLSPGLQKGEFEEVQLQGRAPSMCRRTETALTSAN